MDSSRFISILLLWVEKSWISELGNLAAADEVIQSYWHVTGVATQLTDEARLETKFGRASTANLPDWLILVIRVCAETLDRISE
jgi:hypothetical protein